MAPDYGIRHLLGFMNFFFWHILALFMYHVSSVFSCRRMNAVAVALYC